jgi:hypothetical protein
MDLQSGVNFITIAIIAIFLMPVITGLLNPVTRAGIRHSLHSFVGTFNFITGFLLAVCLARAVFSEKPNGLLTFLGKYAPSVAGLISQYRQDIAAWAIALFGFTAVLVFIMELVTRPIVKHFLVPWSDLLSLALDSRSAAVKSICSGLWQLPKAIVTVLVFCLLLNFYANYINNPSAGDYINASGAYQAVHNSILQPVLNSEPVKKAPELIAAAFRNAAEDFTPANPGDASEPNYWKLPAIKYFNGVTIDEGVRSTPEIDDTAKQIVGDEADPIKKARLLYDWVCKNIAYDQAKAEAVLENPLNVDSGSIVTFQERTGVCFDYSCLYVSMCRAVGVKVRMISGLGYTGDAWGEHVWNQVCDPANDRWINVDTTYGSSGLNYFGNSGFSLNHRYDVMQAEW